MKLFQDKKNTAVIFLLIFAIFSICFFTFTVGKVKAAATTPSGNNATCGGMTFDTPYWQNGNAIMTGQSFTARVTMTNTGTKSWMSDATPHNLGSQGPQDSSTWGTNRVGMPSSPINPGQSVTFSRTFTAPSAPGTYSFSWKMVEDGAEWFGDMCAQNVTVAQYYSNPSSISGSCPAPGTTATVSWPSTSAPKYYLVVNNNPQWVSTNSGSFSTTPGSQPRVWVHSCASDNFCNWFNTVPETTLTCLAPPAIPTLSFSASPTSITQGNSSRLTWTTSSSASSCWGSGGGIDGWKTNTGGSQDVWPSSNTTYYMECWNSAGVSSGKKSAIVNVSLAPPNLLSGSCPAPGTTATLNWSNTGAPYYAMRIDNTTKGTNADPCGGTTGDSCPWHATNSYSFTPIAGDSYRFWVHSCSSYGGECNWAAPVPAELRFTCGVPITYHCSRCSTVYNRQWTEFDSTDSTCANVVPATNSVIQSLNCSCLAGDASWYNSNYPGVCAQYAMCSPVVDNCTNGATNPPTCTSCPSGHTLVSGSCVDNCTNGATNPPTCTSCPSGHTLVSGSCVDNCTNGATNPPTCTSCPSGHTLVSGSCVDNCTNGATNPPTCTLPDDIPTLGSFILSFGGGGESSVTCNAVPLSWTSSSGATAYRILRGTPRSDISPYQPYSALNFTDTSVSPNTSYRYQIEAYNSSGSIRSNTINTTTPYCSPTVSLSASPSSVYKGQAVTLMWTSTNTTSCSASGAWGGSKSINGNAIVNPSSVPTTTYTLSCSGPGGTTVQSVTVSVTNLALPDWIEIIPR